MINSKIFQIAETGSVGAQAKTVKNLIDSLGNRFDADEEHLQAKCFVNLNIWPRRVKDIGTRELVPLHSVKGNISIDKTWPQLVKIKQFVFASTEGSRQEADMGTTE